MNKMKIDFSPPDITEEEIQAVAETLRSGWITTGPKVKEFERRIADVCNTKKAVCLNSATACLEMALRLLGIGPGDEVITTAYTYTATASVIRHVGANIVLADTGKDSYEMDYNQMESLITERTKAIIPVDLAGIICDYERIYEVIERKKNLFRPANEVQSEMGRIAVCADAAHAFGALRKGKTCGGFADFTSFSFHAVKNLTTGEGGALVWNEITGIDSEDIYQKIMLFSLHGQSKDALAKSKIGSWEYDIIDTFYKCNMTDIMASIGLVQLKRYREMLLRRKEIIERYNEGLKELPVHVMNHYNNETSSSGHLYLVRLSEKNREEVNDVIVRMAEQGVATNVHYKPLPLLTAYRRLGFRIEDYPNAASLYENTMTLPLHTKLTDDEIEYVIRVFRQCLGAPNKEQGEVK